MISWSQKAKSPEAAGLFTNETKHTSNSTADDGSLLDILRAELGRFGLAVRKVNPSGYYATCKKSAHFLRDHADMTALCAKLAGSAENTKQAGNLPDSEVFSRPEFCWYGASHVRDGFGRGGRSGNARRSTCFEFSHPVHPHCPKSGARGFQVQQGTGMPTIITVKKRTSVAPNIPPAELTAQARQRLQEAIDLLAGTPSTEDTARALGRVMSASRALKRSMEAMGGGNV